MAQLKQPVLLARIGAAHGINGQVRIKSFTHDPLALADYKMLYNAHGEEVKIKSLRPQKDMLVAKIAGIDSREQAQTLNGAELFVERDQLPDDLDEDEFYLEDLIGLDIYDLEEQNIGKVHALHNFGAGDLIEMRDKNGKLVFIPFTKVAVPTVDFAEKKLIVDSIAAGLTLQKDDEFSQEELEQAQNLVENIQATNPHKYSGG